MRLPDLSLFDVHLSRFLPGKHWKTSNRLLSRRLYPFCSKASQLPRLGQGRFSSVSLAQHVRSASVKACGTEHLTPVFCLSMSSSITTSPTVLICWDADLSKEGDLNHRIRR